MQHRFPAAFYRGGTSKGLFIRSSVLSKYPPHVRDRIVLAAMGSPDPDGRQIDGLGGGISSLSKVAVVGAVDEEGMNIDANKSRWDVVYKFGQVEVKKPAVDWSTTCGNLVAAVGQYAIDTLLPQAKLSHLLSESHNNIIPIRILCANTGATMIARVPTVRANDGKIYAASEGDTHISGVPGTAPGVDIEFVDPAGEMGVLPTGNVRDVVRLDDGKEIEISILHASLPTIFLPASSLPFPLSTLTALPQTLDANAALTTLLATIRRRASQLTPTLSRLYSPSAPKIAFVAPPTSYTTTSNTHISQQDMDLFGRAISVGNVHRTFPATVLMAASAGIAIPGTILHQTLANAVRKDSNNVSWTRIGHPAGVAEAGARVGANGRLESVVMRRTARRLMDGDVLIPSRVLRE